MANDSTKAERRAEERRKKQHGPVGGTVAGQAARMRAAKGYAGSAKKFVRKRSSS
ncbi:MAG: hypothetical protein Q7S96_03810 [bacterium]|nr:hypothetical protein [bacterium]